MKVGFKSTSARNLCDKMTAVRQSVMIAGGKTEVMASSQMRHKEGGV